MPVFIKRPTKQYTDSDGAIVVERLVYTKTELRELLANEPSKFITVSESHAADVLRPQEFYQEVPDGLKAASDIPRPAAESKSGTGSGRSSSSSRSSGGNRGNGRSQRSG